jgi:glycosyltransferase involved in cell wall biosynthesis
MASNYKLSILIVNFNSADFIAVSLKSLFALTKNDFKVHIVDNGSRRRDFRRLLKIVARYDSRNNIFVEGWKTSLRGSLAHGTVLNYLVKKVDTPYFAILDADALWLRKNWDEILISRINDRVKVFGTQAFINSTKPIDFPLMFAILFETKTFRELNIDFRPQNVAAYQDTGYELREKYLNHNFSGGLLNIKSTRNYKQGPFKDIIADEYYLSGDLNIFASHFGRGSTLGAAKYLSTKYRFWYKLPVLGRLLLKIHGGKEKLAWINICRQIINDSNNAQAR